MWASGVNFTVCPTTRASLLKWDQATSLTSDDVTEMMKQHCEDFTDLAPIEMLRVRQIDSRSKWYLIEWTIFPELMPGAYKIVARALLLAAESYNSDLQEPEFLFDAILGFGGRRI